MSGNESHRPASTGEAYDAVIVGASLAGSAAAILLGRSGARVALVEQRPDPVAFKRVCSHYLQASSVAAIERLGLLEPIVKAGGVRSRARIHTPMGWIHPPGESAVPSGVNIRRELLDPMIRGMAASTPGVDLILGHTVRELSRDGDTFSGVLARDSAGSELRLQARLVVGADGRDSKVAKLAGVRTRTHANGRFAYGGYFEGPAPEHAPDAQLWFLDPDMAAAFPTDSGLTFYACMPSKERLANFRRDPARALVEFVGAVPEAPPIGASRLVGEVQGKLDMTNVAHTPTAPGLALIGDAALAIDPLWGVGCGWALQSAEWLADAVAPALAGDGSLARALRRYRRRHARGLRGHSLMIYDYSRVRKMTPVERLMFGAAVHDERVAAIMEAFGTRCIGPGRMMRTAMPRSLAVAARQRLRRGAASDPAPRPVAAPSSGSATDVAR